MILIGCICQGYGIGKNGSIPWKNSSDMRHFRKITDGCTVLVGRNTLLPPLPNRKVVVLYDRDMINRIEYRNALIIGGSRVWIDAFEKGYITEIYLTVINQYYECDTYFPVKYLENYSLESIVKLDEITSVFHYIQ